MKVLFVRGNPRKNGVCEKLASLFEDGLRTGGAEIFSLDMATADIAPCRGCFGCSVGESGKCVIDDGMAEASEFLSYADALVCVSPVYFYSMSAQMKKFFDRCFPFVRGYRYNALKRRVENDANFEVKDKKFITIGAASGRLNGSFGALSATYSTIADALGFKYVADIRRSESPYFGLLGARAIRVRKILDAFRAAGEEFARTGQIARETVEDAELQLTESDEVFAEHAKVFWELSKVRKVGDYGDGAIRSDVRILLREMCKLFVPERAPKRAEIVFEFSDKNWAFAISIVDKRCTLRQLANVSSAKADVRVKTDCESWADFMSRRADALSLISSGKLTIAGDKKLFVQMKRFFDFDSKQEKRTAFSTESP